MSIAMGPTLLLDKSALQAMSGKALSAAYRHYQLVVPPVLVREILANYTKKTKKQNLFDLLVRKFRNASFSVNIESNSLCKSELLGSFVVPLDGRPVVSGVQLDIQKAVAVTEDTVHHKAVKRWLEGVVSETEKERSLEWNRHKNSADLEGFRNEFHARFKKMGITVPRIRSLVEIPPLVDRMLANFDQLKFLGWLTSGTGLTASQAEMVSQRFMRGEMRHLQNFVPYSYFCFRARMIFFTGLVNDLVGTRPSNIIDLDYLLYLPFCKVFSSGDELHEQLAPLLLGPERIFVKRVELKQDLEAIQFF
jgi:hypothetical protein